MASDLHLATNSPIAMRIDGDMIIADVNGKMDLTANHFLTC